ncbi:1937_t:CDS:2 [Scutellospora calospora]|uniref:1937_t:CDS:1 n=1 Tax=Scutellospora calospora TaxID=85575 RepID=A0ACA9KQZ2_9GLOM|nr:1937_t:CDS:2 [Scutellospora calospora]
MSNKPIKAFTDNDNASLTEDKKEQKFVHDVYQAIAPHFSQTRYKPWPVVEEFLKNLDVGSIGADIGCGNGKYLGINKDVYMIGLDRSSNLIEISVSKKHEGIVCDALSLPYRNECFDFAISIAVIHHFTTFERRLAAIKELFRIVRQGSYVLVYVWALEQGNEARRKFDKEIQDVFVPWVIPTDKNDQDKKKVTYNRYYHLFKKGELDELIESTGIAQIVKTDYDKDNWYVIARKEGCENEIDKI